ncbi:hypothetical protein V5O48_012810, partial [Marasmius crinis-equi]
CSACRRSSCSDRCCWFCRPPLFSTQVRRCVRQRYSRRRKIDCDRTSGRFEREGSRTYRTTLLDHKLQL